MHVRKVEVAVGLSNLVWKEVQVDVEENLHHLLDDTEVSRRAEEMIESMAREAGWDVSFIHVLYVESLEASIGRAGQGGKMDGKAEKDFKQRGEKTSEAVQKDCSESGTPQQH